MISTQALKTSLGFGVSVVSLIVIGCPFQHDCEELRTCPQPFDGSTGDGALVADPSSANSRMDANEDAVADTAVDSHETSSGYASDGTRADSGDSSSQRSADTSTGGTSSLGGEDGSIAEDHRAGLGSAESGGAGNRGGGANTNGGAGSLSSAGGSSNPDAGNAGNWPPFKDGGSSDSAGGAGNGASGSAGPLASGGSNLAGSMGAGGTSNCPTYYADQDGDGYGDPTRPFVTCTPGSGYVANVLDCCDSDADAHPGQTQFFLNANACGSFDFNCDNEEKQQENGPTDCDGPQYRCMYNGSKCVPDPPLPSHCDDNFTTYNQSACGEFWTIRTESCGTTGDCPNGVCRCVTGATAHRGGSQACL